MYLELFIPDYLDPPRDVASNIEWWTPLHNVKNEKSAKLQVTNKYKRDRRGGLSRIYIARTTKTSFDILCWRYLELPYERRYEPIWKDNLSP